ncbi:MAG: hypothetical protein AB1486_04535 [Planctomycetota bacterium]
MSVSRNPYPYFPRSPEGRAHLEAARRKGKPPLREVLEQVRRLDALHRRVAHERARLHLETIRMRRELR